MPTCIYCRITSDVSFPKEHVVPRAFGRFHGNLTLPCVCGPCNKFFNGELELFLTRDSVEALLRVRYGLKTKSTKRRLGQNRLTIRVISPGDWYGARIHAERDDAGNEIKAQPLPQVGFRKFGETERRWFSEEQLDQTREWERFRTDADTHIVGKPESVVQRLVDKLLKLGIVFKMRGEFEKHGRKWESTAEVMFGGSTTTTRNTKGCKSLRIVPSSGMPKNCLRCENRRFSVALTNAR
jgi:hypothetical protein